MTEEQALEGNVKQLELHSSIGFDGNTIRGLRVHPDNIHIIYPMGNKVIIKNWETREQHFLSGHTNTISAIEVSRSGKYIASGQINHIGFKAAVILWDFETRTIVVKHEAHRVRVEAVAFSRRDEYLLSLGGRDCGAVVVWDISLGKLICGTEATKGTQGDAMVLYTFNVRAPCFVTAGDQNLVVWMIDANARSLAGVNVIMNKLKRKILCLDVNERDELCFCGTSTGDVLKVRLNFHHDAEVLQPVKNPMLMGCYTKISKKKRMPPGVVELYEMGVRSIILRKNGHIIIGAGDGTVDLVKEEKCDYEPTSNPAYKLPTLPQLRVLKSTNVKASVSSMKRFAVDQLLVGTVRSEIFFIELETFETKLMITCHTATIYDIAFPYNCSDIFATSSKDDVRIWSLKTYDELLRINVPNFSCSKVRFTHDGKSILTAWNDGIIRSFTPLTGRLIYAIMNAHNKGVSALDVTHDCSTILSGGCEGQVRVWDIKPTRQTLVCTLKEHKGPVSAIHINRTDDEAVSASTDGTCIIWDIIRQCRKQILFENTLFMTVNYYPNGVQILTGGSDKKLCYWEVLDGSLVREIEGSPSGAINCLHIASDGRVFVTGGNDQIIKVWLYHEGITTHIGTGHCSVITCTHLSPDSKFIISAGGAGEIFIWKMPEEYIQANPVLEMIDTKGDGDRASVKGENIANLESSRSCASNVSTKSNKSSRTCIPCCPPKPCQPKPCKKSNPKVRKG